MKAIDEFDKIEANEGAGDFRKLIKGGYVCPIKKVIDHADKEYLEIYYDIAEGEYKDWFNDNFEKFGTWNGKFNRSYKDAAKTFFKGFTTAVEQSNPGYKWNWDEKTLANKYIGLVLGEKEYISKTGEIKVCLEVSRNTSIDKIRSGDFKIPDLKKLKPDQKPLPSYSAGTSNYKDISSDDELPWNH